MFLSRNVAVPEGVPDPGAFAVTAAVKVTGFPTTAGFAEDARAVVVPSLFTSCGDPESLPLLFAHPVLPVKLAVITCEPAASVAVLNEACPVASRRTADASTVAPSRNFTVPLGIPAAELTVAVNVTPCPNTDGLGAELTVVLVALLPLCTTCVTAPLLAEERLSEAYTAVRLWLPVLSEDVLNETVPLLPSAFCASTVVPSWKVTIPVGVAAPGGTVATVAVNVTACPGADDARTFVAPA